MQTYRYRKLFWVLFLSILVQGLYAQKEPSSSLVSDSFLTTFKAFSHNIKEQSGIDISLVIGDNREITTSAHRTVSLLLSRDTILFFSSPDLSLMGETQRTILANECSDLLKEKKYEEAVELLFVNYVELIAHSTGLSFSQLIELEDSSQVSHTPLARVALLISLIFILFALFLIHIRRKKVSSNNLNTNFFGGSLWY